MNKTELLKEVSVQSGIQMEECGTVLKTFERVLCKELTRKMYRYGGWILLLIALCEYIPIGSLSLVEEPLGILCAGGCCH